MPETYIIVGAGHGGSRAADCLRRAGFKGHLVLLGDEPYLPYQRPPLCKKYLVNGAPLDRLVLRHKAFYDRSNIDLRLSSRVTQIDPLRQSVELAEGGEVAFDKLLLCLGSRARTLEVAGEDLANVHVLRGLDDARAFRAALAPGRRLVIIGAGYIGLETAATARELGLDVTVIELADRPLARVASPVVAEFYRRRHSEAGVKFLFNTRVIGFSGATFVEAIRTADGQEIPADAVVISVGTIPNTELAAAAGLVCDNGIVVDEYCRTSDPNIYAAGDCTHHPNIRYGRRVRLESIDNALEQARVAASGMCGREALHAHVPWFWSDQYETKLQIAGLSEGFDELVVRGEPERGVFSVWSLRGSELLSVEAVNLPLEFMQAGKWIAEHKQLDARYLTDAAIPLSTL